MKRILISTIAVSALLFNVSCDTNFDQDVSDIVVSKGDADFTKYVALGNSLTSGYRDNALYIDGQNDEDHFIAFIWNIVCLIWTIEKSEDENNDK